MQPYKACILGEWLAGWVSTPILLQAVIRGQVLEL